jgi:hypothetical protein
MSFRTVSASLLGCALLLPFTVHAADRGPSTPEERKQALDYIHAWQADPLGPNAKDEFGWILKWMAEVPDLSVQICTILDKLPKGDKKDRATIFGGAFMAQVAFVIENPDKRTDRLAELQAGVEGSLHVYEFLLKSNPKDRQPYLDDLIQRRDAGTLADFVKQRAQDACKN